MPTIESIIRQINKDLANQDKVCLDGSQSDAVWTSIYHKKYITSYRVR